MVHTLPSPYIACGNVGGEQGVGGSHEEDVTGQLLNDADGATGSGGSGGSGSGSGETEDSSLVRFAAWKKGFMYLRHRSDGRPSAKMAMLLHPNSGAGPLLFAPGIRAIGRRRPGRDKCLGRGTSKESTQACGVKCVAGSEGGWTTQWQ